MKKRSGHKASGKRAPSRPVRLNRPAKSLRYFGDPGAMAVAGNCVKTSLADLLRAKLEPYRTPGANPYHLRYMG